MKKLIVALFALALMPMAASAEESCQGTPLAADGGAPAQAFSGFLEALHAGDVEGMLKFVPADKVDEARAEMTSDEASMAMMQAFMPKDFEVLEATGDGDTACLKLKMVSPFGEATSMTQFVREGSDWKIAEM